MGFGFSPRGRLVELVVNQVDGQHLYDTCILSEVQQTPAQFSSGVLQTIESTA